MQEQKKKDLLDWLFSRMGGANRAFLRHVTRLGGKHAERDKLRATILGVPMPLLSLIIPTFNTKARYLRELFESLQQSELTGAVEMIVVDDGSTRPSTLHYLRQNAGLFGYRLIENSENRGPSETQNIGLRLAQGRFFAIVDHDDRLSPYGIPLILGCLVTHHECELLYTDEVIINSRGTLQSLFLKPAWDPILLSGVNYINHLTIFETERAKRIGGYRQCFDGSHDYDFLLRYARGLSDWKIFHLPYPAYQWRTHKKSLSQVQKEDAIKRARLALSEYFQTYSLKEKIPVAIAPANNPDLHRVMFVSEEEPLISVIIPMRDKAHLTRTVAEGLLSKTSHQQLQIILVDNGSVEPATEELLTQLMEQDKRVEIVMDSGDFNFSRLVNKGVAEARGSYLLLLNNDIEIEEPDWLSEMLQCFHYDQVGIVGAKLLYPNRTLQHAGVIVGFGGLAGHWYEGERSDFPGPMGRLAVRQSVSAVTGACMLVSRRCFEALGGLNEVDFAIAYNDIDFCLRAREQGFKIVWTPFAQLIHHESATRGSDQTPQNIQRFKREQDRLRAIHRTEEFSDPTISPWLSRDRSHPRPVLHPALIPARTNSPRRGSARAD